MVCALAYNFWTVRIFKKMIQTTLAIIRELISAPSRAIQENFSRIMNKECHNPRPVHTLESATLVLYSYSKLLQFSLYYFVFK